MKMMAASVSHEMMAPLNCIKAITAMVLENQKDSQNQKALKIAQNAVKMTIFFVKQLLDQSLFERKLFVANYQNHHV